MNESSGILHLSMLSVLVKTSKQQKESMFPTLLLFFCKLQLRDMEIRDMEDILQFLSGPLVNLKTVLRQNHRTVGVRRDLRGS